MVEMWNQLLYYNNLMLFDFELNSVFDGIVILQVTMLLVVVVVALIGKTK